MRSVDPPNGAEPTEAASSTILERIGLGGLVFAAAVWCAVGIGRRSLWADEALSVGATAQLVDTWRFTGGTMGLYYALLTPWAAVSHDRVWIRVLSACFALAALPVVYRFVRRFGDRWDAALATTVLAGSWAFARYAQEARSYALAMLLTTLSWTVLVRWARTDLSSPDAPRAQSLYTLLAVLALLSHGLTGLQIVAQLTAVWLLPDAGCRLRTLVPSIFACFIALAVLTMVGAAEVANWIPPISLSQLDELVQAFTGPGAPARVGLSVVIIAGAVVAVRTFRRPAAGQDAWLHGVTATWALLPPTLLVLLSLVRPYLLPRYVIGSLPAVAVLVALAVRPLRRRPPVAIAAVLLVVALLAAGRLSLHREPYDDWSGVARAVAADARPDDLLAFPTQTIRPAFDFAWAEIDPAVAPEVISPVGPLGQVRRMYPYHDETQVAGLLAEAAPPRIWVVGAETVGRGDTLVPFLADPALADYREERRHHFDGDITAVLLVRR